MAHPVHRHRYPRNISLVAGLWLIAGAFGSTTSDREFPVVTIAGAPVFVAQFESELQNFVSQAMQEFHLAAASSEDRRFWDRPRDGRHPIDRLRNLAIAALVTEACEERLALELGVSLPPLEASVERAAPHFGPAKLEAEGWLRQRRVRMRTATFRALDAQLGDAEQLLRMAYDDQRARFREPDTLWGTYTLSGNFGHRASTGSFRFGGNVRRPENSLDEAMARVGGELQPGQSRVQVPFENARFDLHCNGRMAGELRPFPEVQASLRHDAITARYQQRLEQVRSSLVVQIDSGELAMRYPAAGLSAPIAFAIPAAMPNSDSLNPHEEFPSSSR